VGVSALTVVIVERDARSAEVACDRQFDAVYAFRGG
jgi:hypothetical protein